MQKLCACFLYIAVLFMLSVVSDSNELCACILHSWFSGTEAIGLLHKCQNAPVPYPTMLHSEQKCDISVLKGAFWDMEQVYSGFVN